MREAVEILGASEATGDITAVLYGDSAAGALGWTPAGIADHGGYRWAIDQAARRISEVGAASALQAVSAV